MNSKHDDDADHEADNDIDADADADAADEDAPLNEEKPVGSASLKPEKESQKIAAENSLVSLSFFL